MASWNHGNLLVENVPTQILTILNIETKPTYFNNRVTNSYHVNMNDISSLTNSSYFIRDMKYSKILWMNKVDGLQQDIEM